MSTSVVAVRPAAAQDRPAIEALLTAAGLPLAGYSDQLDGFLTAWQGGELVGVAGLEAYADTGLLRSVAVAGPARGTGLGQQLVRAVLQAAKARGLKSVALLTTTAPEYFPRFGFRRVERAELPASLKASAEFRGACPATAVAMFANLENMAGGAFPMNGSDETRNLVRTRYAEAAKGANCCGSSFESSGSGCCGGLISIADLSKTMGYSADELAVLPEGANLGLGCGNPQAIASLKPGETVLDLGSGGGIDCFLAARQVGADGKVIGVDMTPEMLARARKNLAESGLKQVEFRLGEIEHLPVADQTVDVIISNCVINLSPEKAQVFTEAYRVLKPGGRLAVSDMVAAVALPAEVRQDAALYAGCIAGAATVAELEVMLKAAGFTEIQITPKDSRPLLQAWGADTKLEDAVFSAHIQAVRPQ